MTIQIFEVGGSIRNELLGLPAKDKDYAVLAPSHDAMRQYILDNGGSIYLDLPEFVSIRANMPNLGPSDFTLARREGDYTDGRHPDTIFPAKCIEDDLARRDFTINAIARNVATGQIHDPFSGRSDIVNRQICCVGDPFYRFREDRLRVFRALRFAVVLDFSIGQQTREAMKVLRHLYDYEAVSVERIREELHKMFFHDTLKSLRLFQNFPELMRIAVEKGLRLKPTLEK